MATVPHTTALPSDVRSQGEYGLRRLHRDHDVDVPGGWLKWYDLAPDGGALPTIRAAARRALADLIATHQVQVAGRAGFVTLLVEPEVLMLTISLWQHEDQLWQSRWELRPAESPVWQEAVHQSAHAHLVADVRELLPIGFERDAWVRFLRSRRTADDLARYRAATMEGAG